MNGYIARIISEKTIELQSKYGDWLWNYLESLVEKGSGTLEQGNTELNQK